MKISGTIEDIIYKNQSNGYTVLNIDFDGSLVTCVGRSADINEGEFVELEGAYTKNAKFGEQFAFEKIKISEPTNCDAIIRYLSSGLIKGIGPVTAAKIVTAFREDTLKIIEYTPERLTEVQSISYNKAKAISAAFLEVKNMQRAVMFLQGQGLTTNMSVRIFNTYLEKTIDIVSKNPYKLIEDVDGVGFATADKIAFKMGVAKNSDFRIRAGLLHILKDTSEKNGNTYLPQEELLSALYELLNISHEETQSQIARVMENLVIDNQITCFDNKGKEAVMLTRFNYMENYVANKLNVLNAGAENKPMNISKEIEEYQKANKITLNADQISAVTMAVKSPVSVITGGPGTGKTTIINCILKILQGFNQRIYLVAPTGRAAKRLATSCSRDASTIHRALEVNFKKEGSSYFKYNEKNKLPADAVIVDEVSMVDISLMTYLLKALSNTCKVVFVGDKDQLPSVGAGNVLHDILESGVINVSYLTQIYRQDENSLIITNAHLINNGKMPDLSNKSTDFFFENRQEAEDILKTVKELVCYRLPKFMNTEPANIQVLSAMKSGAAGVERINKELQALINPPSIKKNEIAFEHTIYRTGDKVMQMVNNYNKQWAKQEGGRQIEGEGVFNGDMGHIANIDFQTGETTVEFEDGRAAVYLKSDITELSISYCCTIHKSQGSEFDVVVIPVVGGSRQIITRNLLYTAVTRAKKLVVLVGSRKNISYMVYNNYTANRYTCLADFLKNHKKKVEFLYGE